MKFIHSHFFIYLRYDSIVLRFSKRCLTKNQLVEHKHDVCECGGKKKSKKGLVNQLNWLIRIQERQ